MRLIKAGFNIEDDIDGDKMLMKLERAGRTCYKSKSEITPETAKKFVAKIMKSGHHSVIEHSSVTVRVVCDRGITHEIVRHRLGAYSQESTRYCDYSGGHITFILPLWFKDLKPGIYTRDDVLNIDLNEQLWYQSMLEAEDTYKSLGHDKAWIPQQSRSVLPNSLKTEIVITYNLRQWRHFFNLRALGTTGKPHPQIVEIAKPMLYKFNLLIPVIFEDLTRLMLDKDLKESSIEERVKG